MEKREFNDVRSLKTPDGREESWLVSNDKNEMINEGKEELWEGMKV